MDEEQDEEQELPTMSTRIECQVTGCDYVAEHTSENVAIALLTSHGQNHKKSKQKAPLDRPECKQDISIEEWQVFENEWSKYKRSHDVDDDLANQLFHCCVKPLRSLLIKENPNIIAEGVNALLNAIRQMAVLHVSTSVCRARNPSINFTNQLFRNFKTLLQLHRRSRKSKQWYLIHRIHLPLFAYCVGTSRRISTCAKID